MNKKTIYKQIREGLAIASQLIIASPVKLPPRVVATAKYVSLGIALLDALVIKEGEDGKEDPTDGH